MNNKYKSASISLALEKLEKDIPKKILFSANQHTYLAMRKEMADKIGKESQLTQHLHTGWMPYIQEVVEHNLIDSFFWIKHYERLSEEYDVPMSWIACIKFKPMLDYTGSYFKRDKLNLLDEEGYAHDIVYGAHIDGVNAGLITTDEFLFQRSEVNIEVSSMAQNFLEDITKKMEFDSPEEFLAQFSHGHDMFIPSHENDDSP